MLEKLAKNHDMWVNMVVKMGCSRYDAEDIVQEMYLRVHRLVKDEKRIMYGNEVNRYFVYITLKNMYISFVKNRNKIVTYPLFPEEEFIDDCVDMKEQAYYQYLIDKLKDLISEMRPYERVLYYLHFEWGYSQRELSRKSGVSLNSINNTCVNIKTAIEHALKEDVKDYRDMNYEL